VHLDDGELDTRACRRAWRLRDHSGDLHLTEGVPNGSQVRELHFRVLPRDHQTLSAAAIGGIRHFADDRRRCTGRSSHPCSRCGRRCRARFHRGPLRILHTAVRLAIDVVGRKACKRQLFVPTLPVIHDAVFELERLFNGQIAEDRVVVARDMVSMRVPPRLGHRRAGGVWHGEMMALNLGSLASFWSAPYCFGAPPSSVAGARALPPAAALALRVVAFDE
jgi:hypothetical protein